VIGPKSAGRRKISGLSRGARQQFSTAAALPGGRGTLVPDTR